MKFLDEWTRSAPSHWSRKKEKHLAALRSGDSITSDSISDEGDYPVFGGNGLRGYTSAYTHEGDYILIGRQGALCGNVNYARGRFWASEHAIVVTRRGEQDVTWLGEVLRYMDLNRLSQSAAQLGISADEVGNLYVFLRHLATKLPRRAVGAAYQFDNEVKLEYYRLQKISEGSISLKDGEVLPVLPVFRSRSPVRDLPPCSAFRPPGILPGPRT